MDIKMTARRLASLGHENRLELFQLLVQAGNTGMTVSEIQTVLDRPASTVAFHLRELVAQRHELGHDHAERVGGGADGAMPSQLLCTR